MIQIGKRNKDTVKFEKSMPKNIDSNEQKRRMIKMNELKCKIERKIIKMQNLRNNYEQLKTKNDFEKDANFGKILAEIKNKLFDAKVFKNNIELLDEIEHLDIDQINTEIFVDDFLDSDAVKFVLRSGAEHKAIT